MSLIRGHLPLNEAVRISVKMRGSLQPYFIEGRRPFFKGEGIPWWGWVVLN